MTALQCYAYRHGEWWHAICTDLDIAVDGESLPAVVESLETCIDLYLEDVAELPAEERERFLTRRAPWRVRAVVGDIDLAPSSQGRRRRPGMLVSAGIPRRRILLTDSPAAEYTRRQPGLTRDGRERRSHHVVAILAGDRDKTPPSADDTPEVSVAALPSLKVKSMVRQDPNNVTNLHPRRPACPSPFARPACPAPREIHAPGGTLAPRGRLPPGTGATYTFQPTRVSLHAASAPPTLRIDSIARLPVVYVAGISPRDQSPSVSQHTSPSAARNVGSSDSSPTCSSYRSRFSSATNCRSKSVFRITRAAPAAMSASR